MKASNGRIGVSEFIQKAAEAIKKQFRKKSESHEVSNSESQKVTESTSQEVRNTTIVRIVGMKIYRLSTQSAPEIYNII
jgi:hypothetical protein